MLVEELRKIYNRNIQKETGITMLEQEDINSGKINIIEDKNEIQL